MSDATFQAVHDAIAAHIADVNEGEPEYLTEWLFVASAVTGQQGQSGYSTTPKPQYPTST